MGVLYGGVPFSGVTYNQGAFTGNRGHVFIKGKQQCSYGLNLKATNRIYQPVKTIAELKNVIEAGNVCEQCAKNVGVLIKEYEEAK